MSWTKRQILAMAYKELGYASYLYDAEPEDLEQGLMALDSLVATWEGKGIRIGYPLSSEAGNSSLDDVTGVPLNAIQALYCNLAIRVAPSIGKTPSQDTRVAAKTGLDYLLTKAATPNAVALRSIPTGAGNKQANQANRPFTNPDNDALTTGQDNEITFK